MRTFLIKVVMVGCLFVSILAKAQNPFITKADIIAQFDVSPNNQQLCCKWWGANAMAKIRIKDLSTQKVLDIDSVSLKKSSALYFADGISFLSDNLILFCKDEAILSYDVSSHKFNKLLNLSSLKFHAPQCLASTHDKKGLYLLAYRNIYYADLQDGIQDSLCLNKNVVVTGISTTVNNQVIYGTREDLKFTSIYKIWSWDGRNNPIEMTDLFSKSIKVPYLVSATSTSDLYIVANEDGVYRFDTSTQKTKKLVDNDKEDPVIVLRVSAGNQAIYYLTASHRVIVKTMNMDGKQGESIFF